MTTSLLGMPLGTLPQWGAFLSLLTLIAGCITVYIKGIPERLRVTNEGVALKAKIEEDLRGEAAMRFKEFRTEVHSLRNELAKYVTELTISEASRRRGSDKLSMMAFVLKLVMGELRRLDPKSQIVDQAEKLLEGILEDDPPEADKSKALKQAEFTVSAAHDTVDEVKHAEAKIDGNGK